MTRTQAIISPKPRTRMPGPESLPKRVSVRYLLWEVLLLKDPRVEIRVPYLVKLWVVHSRDLPSHQTKLPIGSMLVPFFGFWLRIL